MKNLVIVSLLGIALGIMACGAEVPDPETDGVTGETKEALTNNGGGSLGYTCSITTEGTNCSCDAGTSQCDGLDTMCRQVGWTYSCKMGVGSLGGRNIVCTCSSNPSPYLQRTSPEFIGAGITAATRL